MRWSRCRRCSQSIHEMQSVHADLESPHSIQDNSDLDIHTICCQWNRRQSIAPRNVSHTDCIHPCELWLSGELSCSTSRRCRQTEGYVALRQKPCSVYVQHVYMSVRHVLAACFGPRREVWRTQRGTEYVCGFQRVKFKLEFRNPDWHWHPCELGLKWAMYGRNDWWDEWIDNILGIFDCYIVTSNILSHLHVVLNM